MKNVVLIFSLLSIPYSMMGGRGDIVFAELMEQQTAADYGTEVTQQTGYPASVLGVEYDIVTYKIGYETLDYDGISITIATGVIAFPANYPCAAALATYGHGFSLKHGEVPSSGGSSIYYFIGKGLASNGYVSALPDYIHLGFDADSGFQAFMHAASEASATVDLLRATRTFCAQQNIPLNGQLFLTGYSQGGHSTMATAREIQTKHSGEFTVTGAVPGGGTYDLSGIAADSLASPTRTTAEPHALCMVARSYWNIYLDTLLAINYPYSSFDSVFKYPYDTLLREILDPLHPNGNVGLLNPIPNLMLRDDIRIDFQTNPNSVMRQLLSYNDVYDWSPQMPMRIYHSDADIQNPYDNVLFTIDRFEQNGASPEVKVVTINGLGHFEAGLFHVLFARNWIDSLRTGCEDTTGIVSSRTTDIILFPQPAKCGDPLFITGAINERVRYNVYSIEGRLYASVNGKNYIATEGLLPGIYVVEVIPENGNKYFKRFVLQ